MANDLRNILHRIVNLRETTDTKGTIDSIRKGTEIKGYNVWILACGAMLASIGLDQNSVAVIIGAMLISPLMSPILGIGLAFGINDREHLFVALESFAIAVIASLGVSTLYFLLTPFDGAPGPEITNRTTPTLLDVLIALFGGTAGIVAASRKEKTNAIPGVAIATALMPPICTAGYGLAKSDWGIFFGAFYLFFINAVFISLSTYLIVRYLKFPYAEYPDDGARRKALGWIFIFALLLIAPSVYFFYNVINRVRMENNINTFISTEINSDNHKVSNTELDPTDSIPKLILYIAGNPISKDSMAILREKKKDYHLEKLQLKFLQVALSEEALADRSTQKVIKTVSPQFALIENRLDSLMAEIDALEKERDSEFGSIQRQAKGAFPQLINFTLAKVAYGSDMSSKVDTLCLAVSTWDKALLRTGKTKVQEENSRLKNWLKEAIDADSIRVITPL